MEDKDISTEIVNQLDTTVKSVSSTLSDFPKSEDMKAIINIFPSSRVWIKDTISECNDLFSVSYFLTVLNTLSEYKDNLRDYIRAVDFTGNLQDFLYSPADMEPAEVEETHFETWISITDPARASMIDALAFTLAVENKLLPGSNNVYHRSIGARKVKRIPLPLDKVNDVIWRQLFNGSLEQPIKAEGKKTKKTIDIMYSIDFDNIEIPVIKRLMLYDKRVYIAVGALYNAGNIIVTLSMIYQAMGYKGEPGKADRDKINNSLTKFKAQIHIDNWQEITAKYNYPSYTYDGDLLPFERLTPDNDNAILMNGQTAEEYIHIFREPPLLTFARCRNQITTINPKVLQTPLNKTEENMAIEDYCLRRIAQYKREGKKILLSTLYDKCNIDTRMKKSRTPNKIKKLFDYYVECGEVKDYTLTENAISFTPNREI